MKSQPVRFPGAFGNQLAARLEWPETGPPRAFVVFAHCFTCSKDLKAVHRISRSLTERGLAVLRFDFSGLGESEGEFADTNFSSNLEDLRAAVAFLRQEHQPPSLMIGHSLGGTAVLAVAGEFPEVRAVATIGSPSDTEHVRAGLVDRAPDVAAGEADEATIRLAGRPIKIRRQLLDDLGRQTVLEAIANLGRPLAVFHSPIDDVVDIDHARRIYQTAKHPKSFISLDDADHLLLRNPQDAFYVGTVLAAWAGRYLGFDDAPPAGDRPEHKLDHGEVHVHGGASGFLQTIETESHRFLGDEPVRVGGTDLGPTPYDLLLAALGTCTSMTLRMYASHKGLPLEGVDVALRHGKIHAADCEDCETEKGKVDEIVREITIHGDALEPAQRKRLLEIADRCPVHRTLEGEIKIRTRAGGTSSSDPSATGTS